MSRGIDRELKRGTLEMILLQLLSERPMYGYELISTLEARGGPPFQLKEGTLYPVLYRLEDAALIEAQWQTVERGVPRKYYRVTEAGAHEREALVGEWSEFVAAVNRLLGLEEVQR
jgi:PadR family transcriptional regulator, regulatory protein PadR